MQQETSREAYESVLGELGNIQRALIKHLIDNGPATCDEVEVSLDMRHQTCSSGFTRLKDKGLINDSGERRLTRTRRRAIVWTLSARDKAGRSFE